MGTDRCPQSPVAQVGKTMTLTGLPHHLGDSWVMYVWNPREQMVLDLVI